MTTITKVYRRLDSPNGPYGTVNAHNGLCTFATQAQVDRAAEDCGMRVPWDRYVDRDVHRVWITEPVDRVTLAAIVTEARTLERVARQLANDAQRERWGNVADLDELTDQLADLANRIEQVGAT